MHPFEQRSAMLIAPPRPAAPVFPTVPELFAQFRELAYKVAPELERTRLYLLETPPGYPQRPPGCLAFTADPDDYRVRDYLIARGEWKGPGILLVLNLPECEKAWRLGLLLHELAHRLPVVDPRPDREFTDEERAFQDKQIEGWNAAAQPIDLPPFAWCHEWPFMRRCIHLRYRAQQVGVKIEARSLRFGGHFYGMESGESHFEAALGNEPAEAWKYGCTFAEIDQAPPPDEFLKLYYENVGKWFANKGATNCCKR